MAAMARPKKNSKEEKAVAKVELLALTEMEKKPRPVNYFVTHNEPHPDEITSYTFLVDPFFAGEELFPGIRSAKILLWSEGKILSEYGNKTADELLEEEGMLLVGVGRGMFDEHGKSVPTSAHLVAAYLGVLDNPEVQQILKLCKRYDHDGHSMPGDLQTMTKDRYAASDGGEQSQAEVFLWAYRGIRDMIFGQRCFEDCENDFDKTGKIFGNKIVSVISDNRKMNKWVRHHYQPDITIQISESGDVIIFPSYKKGGPSEADIVRVLRTLEIEKRYRLWWQDAQAGKIDDERNQPFHFPLPTWQILEKEGNIVECPEWYFYENGGQIMSGCLTAPEAKKTLLVRQEIEAAVAICYTHLFENQSCKDGCDGYLCPLYRFGLFCCRKKRMVEKSDAAIRE